MMKRLTSIATLLLLALTLFSCHKTARREVFDAVPASSAVIVESSQPKDFVASLKTNSFFLPVMDSTDTKSLVTCINTLLSSDGKLGNELGDSQMAFALVMTNKSFKELGVVSLSKRISNNDIRRVFESQGYGFETLEGQGVSYGRVVMPDTMFVMTKDVFLLLSADEETLLMAAAQTDKPSLADDKGFRRVHSTLKDNAGAHLYLNYSMLCDDSEVIGSTENEHAATSLDGFAALDVLPKDAALIMNGYSVAGDSLSLLSAIKGQKPVKNGIAGIVPGDTKIMLHLGMSDFTAFWRQTADKQAVNGFEERYGVSIANDLMPSLTEVAYGVFGAANTPFMVAHFDDTASVTHFMNVVATVAGLAESCTVEGHPICRLALDNFASDVFGNIFKPIVHCCYAISGDNLFIANTMSAVQTVVTTSAAGNALSDMTDYKAFQDNMLETANVTLLLRGGADFDSIDAYASGFLAGFLKNKGTLLNGSMELFLQLSASGDLVYTSAGLMSNGVVPIVEKAEQKEVDNHSLWKTKLENPLKGKPFIAPGDNGGMAVVAFDESDNMYLVDGSGKVLWSKALDETPMSDVFAVDAFRDGGHQYLFNSAKHLYLIDKAGHDVKGYPKKLLAPASNGMALVDYDNSRNYRILICGTDKKVYNYGLDGAPIQGWETYATANLVTKPVQHVVAASKDFLLVSDTKGVMSMLDRHGKVRINLPADVRKSQNADFYPNVSNHKGIIITSDEVGKLLYVAFDGKISRSDFGDYSDSHQFLYGDFNGNGDPDFIYLDANVLKVFDRVRKVECDHIFDCSVTGKPMLFRTTSGKNLIAVFSESARQIFLIGKDGNEQVFEGETPFAIGSLSKGNTILLTGVGKEMVCYSVE